ncbi:MAG: hypothetical protein DRN04_16680 [Thermoprotei archaeon]|nr:MAG: hypothetical protein DRN04_16680 [Thermoprotei archaeon]
MRRGLAGLVAGLIAAIALLVIALPVMMQYQQHITKSYHIKEYATMLEEQKEAEEKGLASCYDPSAGIISINNTLGENVTIVLAYASDGENEEIKCFQPGKIIAPGINKISIADDLGISLDPSRIKILKLVTSRGTIIQPPYCSETAPALVIIAGAALNMLLEEEQAPGGLLAATGSETFAHGLIRKIVNNTLVFINGTLVPTPESTGSGYMPLAFRADLKIEDPNIDLTIERYDVGDYLLMVINTTTSYDYVQSDIGCYNTYCYTFHIRGEHLIYALGYSYVLKYDDSDDNGPLKYTLINNGYDHIVIGVEFNNPEETGLYNGTIYVSKVKVSDVSESDLIAKFFVDKTGKNINATLYVNGNIINATAFYRTYYIKDPIPSIDQFAIYVPVEDLLNVEFGESLWIKTAVTYCSSECVTDDSEWISFTYNPLKLIVDLIYRKYFGS